MTVSHISHIVGTWNCVQSIYNEGYGEILSISADFIKQTLIASNWKVFPNINSTLDTWTWDTYNKPSMYTFILLALFQREDH